MKKYFLLTIIFINFNLKADVKIEDCASIESDVKRLACYDYLVTGVSKTSEELSSNSDNKIVKVDEIKQSSTDVDSNFGLPRNKIKEKDKITAINSLTSYISSISKTYAGKSRFKLQNNQLWESESILSQIKLNNFKKKNQIIIEEANMGGFWMINKDSKIKIKVKRIS
tara:strand:+ start:900 stop:1406 length:507 start_codon:yes stop_codon:yes gene_type:complete